MKKFLFAIVIFVAVGSIAANVLLWYRYSTARPIMRIGSEKISKKDYQDRLDYLYGKQVLSKMAFDQIIHQSAKKENVEPTEKDVDNRISMIARTRPRAIAEAQQDSYKMKDLRNDLWMQIALENLRMKGISISNSEVAAFYEKNKARLALPEQADTSIAASSDRTNAEGAAQMMRQKIDMGVIARQMPQVRVVGVTWRPNWDLLPPQARKQLQSAVASIPVGSVSIVPVTTGKDTIFFVVRVDQRRHGGTPPLAQIQDQLTRNLKLQKAPSVRDMMAKLYKEANIAFEVDKYSGFFEDIRRYAEEADKQSSEGKSPDKGGAPAAK